MGGIDTIDLVLLVFGLALLVPVAVLLLEQARLRRRFDALGRLLEAQQSAIRALDSVVRNVQDDGAVTQQRERELAEHVALLSRQQEQLLIRDADSGPYFQAIRSARSGASAEALMSAYGLSRGEAELVVTLHRPEAG